MEGETFIVERSKSWAEGGVGWNEKSRKRMVAAMVGNEETFSLEGRRLCSLAGASRRVSCGMDVVVVCGLR